MAWIIGNENLPSVKSSQNPLLFVYCKIHVSISHSIMFVFIDTYTGGLQIHIIITYLKMNTYNVDEWSIIAFKVV